MANIDNSDSQFKDTDRRGRRGPSARCWSRPPEGELELREAKSALTESEARWALAGAVA